MYSSQQRPGPQRMSCRIVTTGESLLVSRRSTLIRRGMCPKFSCSSISRILVCLVRCEYSAGTLSDYVASSIYGRSSKLRSRTPSHQ